MKIKLKDTFQNLKRLDDKMQNLKNKDFPEVEMRINELEEKKTELINKFSNENKMSVDNYTIKYYSFVGISLKDIEGKKESIIQ